MINPQSEDGNGGTGLLTRRTALLGLGGVAGGGLLGYRAFLSEDEPAFAFDGELGLSAENLEINTVDGNVESIELSPEATTVEISWINFPQSEFEDDGEVPDNIDDEFEVTISLEKDGTEDELTTFTLDLPNASDNLPHNEYDEDDHEPSTTLSEADVEEEDVDLTDHTEISEDYSEFEPEDDEDEKETDLRFEVEVTSTTLSEADYGDEEHTATDSDDLTVTVTDEDAEISVGGTIELEGESGTEAYSDEDEE
ncbi:hypothetical protein RBH26_11900 [Natronolimnohabitans sp. A-GB9]|uniref:hypothetical protein n=1 Tax=Natronolimnohabitans sp. A-GB9 TaxID=3069757 RepID=UPI0027B7BED2|nr:hypothetical protein [Natronolimnohabitans sp. A-GB9]MDQ2051184.1 hypothetical protein [Natronolimnohabitans sp. A-GB9]